MKIRDTLAQAGAVQNKVEKDDKNAQKTSQSMFGSQLRKIDTQNYEQRLTSILDSIQKQSVRLSKNVDIKELQVYKKLVSEFLYEATSHAHKFQKESLLDRRGRHRVFATIKTVNKDLDELTEEVLKEEKDNIKILQKLDDIRGLLLDIMM